ncbi:baseplate J/gp47 family protein [Mahella australiensis]|uniref:Baseplate J family protein n=1 Tax=Mahella australiensis (strain DSM 15567 / CIP 107919 / 50-1 BON) TaxID=697281 RepID=F3ZZX6_MAHA5|nr:baseplate J/gp47 family protein [Mahella australiensis]AEE95794.1 Baseplate J family protein [Mahella australiensis 50-1 BON]
MATLPDYLTDQTEEEIKRRMLDALPDDLDKSEGSYIWDALSPAAIELALAALWVQEVLRRGFATTTFGSYLDLRCDEHGLTRLPAVKATGQVIFLGTAGTVVPKGTYVSTASDGISPIILFETIEDATINDAGTAFANIAAVEAGVSGNVPAGAITMLSSPISGVSSVTNPTATTGGLDTEDDASLLTRYLQRVRSPSASGNKADYVNWAMEVHGVGGVSVVPARDGPGTVSISIINTTKVPAEPELVKAVQDYIAPPWVNEIEAEDMTLGGYGVSIDDTQADDIGSSVKMIYDASGAGTITHTNTMGILKKPGIWQARTRIKVNSADETSDLIQIGVWNFSTNSWAKTHPNGIVDAVITCKASDLSTGFEDKIVEFYWDGQDQIELRITRLTSDAATVVWVDRIIYRSTFSKDTGEGKAPVGARVTVEPAIAVLINVSATLSIMPGYDANSVKSAVHDNIAAYIRSLAFTSDNDVRYVRIGQAILDTPGIMDYQNLMVNGDVANIAIDSQEVAVLGSVNFS